MIERKILAMKIREKEIEDFILSHLGKLVCSSVKLQRTPLGEKITVYTSKPGLIVGRKGSNIRELTQIFRDKFKMENPQIEVIEIENPNLDAAAVAKQMVGTFERFGPKRFKAVAYRALDNVMKAGARGVEIVVHGRGIPSERTHLWRFFQGYLKKSGDISASFIDRHNESSNLKSGTVGVKVSILKPDVVLPDDITIYAEQKKKKEKLTVQKTPVEKEAAIIAAASEKKDNVVREASKKVEVKKEEKVVAKKEASKKVEKKEVKEKVEDGKKA
jgi:small subunit ribosomal protein S3